MSTRNAAGERQPRINFNPYPEQRDVLDSNARYRVVAAGRRSGKTILAAVETVKRACHGGSSWRGYWVGAEHHHADTAYRLVEEALPTRLVASKKQSPPRSIELVSGATIEFHTAGGGALVSIGLDWVVCDESAKDFPERSWTQELRPALSDKQGDAMFISTPQGRGWFFERYQRGQSPDFPDWQSWSWPTYQNPHVEDSEVDDAKDGMPERIWRQEYLADFVSESGGVFEHLDDRLFTASYPLPVPPAAPPFATGVDFARHQDYRVAITLDSTGHVVHFDREQHEAWPQIQRAVETIADEYPGVVAVDASRDNKIVADLEHAGVNVEPVQFSPQRKQSLIENLITRIENGELTAPPIEQLRHELELFEYDVTPAGNVRYQAPGNYHDDCVDALSLAASVMGQGRVPTGTARVGEAETEERQKFNESELGEAVKQFRQTHR